MIQFKMVSQEEASNQQFRYDLPVYAYIRFSTLGQVKDSKQSKKQQDTRMHEKLVNMGFTNFVKKDKDEGISAQKGTDERADLADIYDEDKTPEEELTQDLLAIIASFAGRLYGLRSRKQRQLLACAEQVIQTKDA